MASKRECVPFGDVCLYAFESREKQQANKGGTLNVTDSMRPRHDS